MKPKVYIETSVISYLAARPSRDIIIAGRQAETHDWWEKHRHRFELLISIVVESEIGRGDPAQAAKRQECVSGITSVAASGEAAQLAESLLAMGAIPPGSEEDALHVAIAATQGAEYLVTWNFKHINNAEKRNEIVSAVRSFGYVCPQICSPEALGGDRDG